VSCAKTTEPIDLQFGLWTKHKFSRICQVAPMCRCPHGRAHWRHMANTIAAAMRPYVKLLWPLVKYAATLSWYCSENATEVSLYLNR